MSCIKRQFLIEKSRYHSVSAHVVTESVHHPQASGWRLCGATNRTVAPNVQRSCFRRFSSATSPLLNFLKHWHLRRSVILRKKQMVGVRRVNHMDAVGRAPHNMLESLAPCLRPLIASRSAIAIIHPISSDWLKEAMLRCENNEAPFSNGVNLGIDPRMKLLNRFLPDGNFIQGFLPSRLVSDRLSAAGTQRTLTILRCPTLQSWLNPSCVASHFRCTSADTQCHREKQTLKLEHFQSQNRSMENSIRILKTTRRQLHESHEKQSWSRFSFETHEEKRQNSDVKKL